MSKTIKWSLFIMYLISIAVSVINFNVTNDWVGTVFFVFVLLNGTGLLAEHITKRKWMYYVVLGLSFVIAAGIIISVIVSGQRGLGAGIIILFAIGLLAIIFISFAIKLLYDKAEAINITIKNTDNNQLELLATIGLFLLYFRLFFPVLIDQKYSISIFFIICLYLVICLILFGIHLLFKKVFKVTWFDILYVVIPLLIALPFFYEFKHIDREVIIYINEYVRAIYLYIVIVLGYDIIKQIKSGR